MKWVMTALLTALGGAAQAAEVRLLPIPNGGFEDGLAGWTIDEEAPVLSSLSTAEAATGAASLLVDDQDPGRGSWARATPVPFVGMGSLEVRGRILPVSGSGLGVYVQQVNAAGELISGESHIQGLGGSSGKWEPFSCPFYTLPACASIRLVFHSYNAATVRAYLDDLHFAVLPLAAEPPWQGTYRIRPGETDRLTPADVVGPDGIVYPNWTRCGVDGGIPDVPVKARLRDFGALPGDGRDMGDALDRACRAVAEAGGGAVLLEAGTYVLDRPVTVRDSGVVIRGAGPQETRIIFRYALPEGGIAFYTPAAGQTLGPRDRIEVHALPKGLQRLRIASGERTLREWQRSLHSGNTFWTDCRADALFRDGAGAAATLTAEAHYEGGLVRTAEVRVPLDADAAPRSVPSAQAVLTFAGSGPGRRLPLAEDAKRGTTALVLESAEGLGAGDHILLTAPATEGWNALVRNQCKWGSYREYAVRVVAVAGSRVTIEQPLRLDFPVADGSFVQPTSPIQWCGVEDLSIEQTEDLWISTVHFLDAWNCWARRVHVRMTGRFPVHASRGKWCEIRDCVFDDAWFKGGGGTAYAGWQRSWDCLMDGVETFNYRHAPLVQWAAAGCVIRNGVFHNSDGQWHAGWTNENLFENCVITSRRGHGSYGFGMWASPPEDVAHGPNGPRNVVYNCDTWSERAGLWMGGMNENWLILHNRFVVERGPGVFAKTASFDHILAGNVFVLEDGVSPALELKTPDCVGIEAAANRIYGGNGTLTGGAGRLALDEGNQVLPRGDGMPPRPAPAVPSIYAWQQATIRWERALPIR